jgi:hypothetical protein
MDQLFALAVRGIEVLIKVQREAIAEAESA